MIKKIGILLLCLVLLTSSFVVLGISSQDTKDEKGEEIVDWTKTLPSGFKLKDTPGYGYRLTGDEQKDLAIWGFVEKLYGEWYTRYQEILSTPDITVEPIKENPAEFDTKISAARSYRNVIKNFGTKYDTRTMASLKDFKETPVQYDEYGGLDDPASRQEATGHFYVKQIGDRWWLIDPLGNKCYMRGASGMTYTYHANEAQKNAAIARYGSFEKWAIAETYIMKNFLYMNTRSVLDPGNSLLMDMEDRMNFIDKISIMWSYEDYLGTRNTDTPSGSTLLKYGMHVFDAGFENKVDSKVKSTVASRKESGQYYDPHYIGNATDNEIPTSLDMLTQFMQLDVTTMTVNYYSYAAAWTFLAHQTGKNDPTLADAENDDLKDLFRGFVYDRYYCVATTAIRKYDPDHLILGCRTLMAAAESEWICRFTGYWCDVMSFNWYREWTPSVTRLQNISTWTNKPLMITEFGNYAVKGDNGEFLVPEDIAYSDMAGWVVMTQEERGKVYQNFTLRLLECKNFIGWNIFQFLDSDIEKPIGLVNSKHEFYQTFGEYIGQVNKNVYGLIDYFDHR